MISQRNVKFNESEVEKVSLIRQLENASSSSILKLNGANYMIANYYWSLKRALVLWSPRALGQIQFKKYGIETALNWNGKVSLEKKKFVLVICFDDVSPLSTTWKSFQNYKVFPQSPKRIVLLHKRLQLRQLSILTQMQQDVYEW